MKLIKPVTLLFAAVMLVVAAPARAIEVPAQAVGDDTLAVIWIDMTRVDAEMVGESGAAFVEMVAGGGLEGLGIALPAGDAEQMVESLLAFHEGFVAAGGEGLLISIGMPTDETWSPTMSLLARSSGEIDTQAMTELLGTMSGGERTAQIEAIGEGWHHLSILSAAGVEETSPLPEPSEEASAAFARPLGTVQTPGLSIAVRIPQELRNMLMGMAGGAPGEDGARVPQDPQMQMMMQMIEPLQGLDTLGFALSSDDQDQMQVDVQMAFEEQVQATQFFNMYNSIMTLMPMMVFQQTQNVQGAPDPATINRFFMLLRMQSQGEVLSLRLDNEFFELAEQIVPLMEGLAQPAAQAAPPAQGAPPAPGAGRTR